MGRTYRQYCPVAHALDVVGERWSLLVVRDLMEHGPQRYSDLHARLTGCGTNILADRLKKLERHGVVARRRLPPPAACTVYELTPYGEELRPVLHELAHWGARALGPPAPNEDLQPGWLPGALRLIFLPKVDVCVEFRIGDEVASVSAGTVREGPADGPDAVVESDAAGFYHLLVEGDYDGVTVEGSREALERLLATLPPHPAPAVGAAA